MFGPPSLPQRPPPNTSGPSRPPYPVTSLDGHPNGPSSASSRAQPGPGPCPPPPQQSPPPLPPLETTNPARRTSPFRPPPGGVPLPPAPQQNGTPIFSSTSSNSFYPSPTYTPTHQRLPMTQHQQHQQSVSGQHLHQSRTFAGQSPVIGDTRPLSAGHGQAPRPRVGGLLFPSGEQQPSEAPPALTASDNLRNAIQSFEESEQRSFNQRQAQLQTIKTHYTEHTASHSQEVGALTAKHAAEKADLIETKTQLSTSADDFRDRLHKKEREHAQLVALSADNEAKLEAKLKVAEATIEQERAESAKTTEQLETECTRLTAAHEKTSCALTHTVAGKEKLTDQLKTVGEEIQVLVRADDAFKKQHAEVVKERDRYKTAYLSLTEVVKRRMLEQRKADDKFESDRQGLDDGIDVEGLGAQSHDGRDGLIGSDGSEKDPEPAPIQARTQQSPPSADSGSSAGPAPAPAPQRAAPSSARPDNPVPAAAAPVASSSTSAIRIPTIVIAPATSPGLGISGLPSSASSAPTSPLSPPSRASSTPVPSGGASRTTQLHSHASASAVSPSSAPRHAASDASSSSSSARRTASKRQASEPLTTDSTSARGKKARVTQGPMSTFKNARDLGKMPDETDPVARAEWITNWIGQLFNSNETCKLCANEPKTASSSSSDRLSWAGDERKKLSHLETVHAKTWSVAQSGHFGRSKSVGP